ncbi:hypothetical protein COY25_02440 [Candidatus Uhrbacteria bacterium CG_4_10_14_0_2_um_filter_41_7]|uniref:Uncharacterized protein n=1 Tax=Candidatus Uhrbacteria bacterium CG_4_9_14_3_um_filter_41_35 TaxID=1975034 RepID=A0A2M7XE07_9BACT|nr:MAG: hypothetical protein COV92_02070 [Candidatus Uhrbacteria bacterium CG11_big_fil_rev_8_21_14_0_20_41_9]PIZ54156.1 MAG: hypothetical protein COY25_02440 [Candidatus Uhrbacteria bacterium CG_4_10_14_0_2_um_filter_41_7]PJA46114.1 MAG: hypothetical protein CO173_03680 [Candidatus Uhrbacteria bacterium CG_4_9_14_3_um_filter_41_35]
MKNSSLDQLPQIGEGKLKNENKYSGFGPNLSLGPSAENIKVAEVAVNDKGYDEYDEYDEVVYTDAETEPLGEIIPGEMRTSKKYDPENTELRPLSTSGLYSDEETVYQGITPDQAKLDELARQEKTVNDFARSNIELGNADRKRLIEIIKTSNDTVSVPNLSTAKGEYTHPNIGVNEAQIGEKNEDSTTLALGEDGVVRGSYQEESARAKNMRESDIDRRKDIRGLVQEKYAERADLDRKEVDPYVAEVNAAKDAQESTLARRMEIRQLIENNNAKRETGGTTETRQQSTETLLLNLNELKDEENLLVTALNKADQTGNFDAQSEISANLQKTREELNQIRTELAYRKKEQTLEKMQSDVFEATEAENLDKAINSRKSAERVSNLETIKSKSTEALEQDFDELGDEADLLQEALNKAEEENDAKRQAEIINEIQGTALEMQAIYQEFTDRNAKEKELAEQQAQSFLDRDKLKQELKANAEAIMARKNQEHENKIAEEKEAGVSERIFETEYNSSEELEADFAELEAEDDLLEATLKKAIEAGDQKKQAEILNDIQNLALEMRAINKELDARNVDVVKVREEERLLRKRAEAREKLRAHGEAILARIQAENPELAEPKREKNQEFGGFDSREDFNKALELRKKLNIYKEDKANILKLRGKMTEVQFKDEQLVLKDRLQEILAEGRAILGDEFNKAA